jgi:hypothetical protein
MPPNKKSSYPWKSKSDCNEAYLRRGIYVLFIGHDEPSNTNSNPFVRGTCTNNELFNELYDSGRSKNVVSIHFYICENITLDIINRVLHISKNIMEFVFFECLNINFNMVREEFGEQASENNGCITLIHKHKASYTNVMSKHKASYTNVMSKHNASNTNVATVTHALIAKDTTVILCPRCKGYGRVLVPTRQYSEDAKLENNSH